MTNQPLLETIDRSIYRAAKIVSGAIHRTSKEIVYKELGWHSLSERRQIQRLKVFHKMINGKTPVYLQNEIPAPDPNHEHLRSKDDIPKIRGMVLLENTFIPKTITEWNTLNTETRSSDSSETFCKKITRETEVPSWYLTGDREANMWHARMRMRCSPLNDDLHSQIHVLENSECACGYKKENSKHFLLDCPLYNVAREKMLNNLLPLGFKPTKSNLLFGNSKYSELMNKNAFEIIQTFIRETKRFK